MMTDVVEVAYNVDLVHVLDALGIAWEPGRSANGRQATIRVPVDPRTDARLEHLVGDLSDLRWHYEPGRCLQLAFDLGLEEG